MKRKLILWIMQTRLYAWLLIKVIPYIRFTCYYTSLKGYQYQKGYKKLSKGDIVLTVDKKKLTSMLIPGTWTHAALCVGKGSAWELSEMTHENYRKSTFFDICKEADRVCILRCKDWTRRYIARVVDRCKTFENVPYDMSFMLGVKALYCSELIFMSDIEGRLKVDLSDLAGLGREYISPDGLYLAENVKVIWDSDK